MLVVPHAGVGRRLRGLRLVEVLLSLVELLLRLLGELLCLVHPAHAVPPLSLRGRYRAIRLSCPTGRSAANGRIPGGDGDGTGLHPPVHGAETGSGGRTPCGDRRRRGTRPAARCQGGDRPRAREIGAARRRNRAGGGG